MSPTEVSDRSARALRREQREEGEALLSQLRADIKDAEDRISWIVCQLAERVDLYRVDSGSIGDERRRKAMLEIRDSLNDLVHEAREQMDDYAESFGRYAP